MPSAVYDSTKLGALTSVFDSAKANIERQRPLEASELAELGRYIISIGQDGLDQSELVGRAVRYFTVLNRWRERDPRRY